MKLLKALVCRTSENRLYIISKNYEFSSKTGLPVLKVTEVGLEPFRKLILEALAKL